MSLSITPPAITVQPEALTVTPAPIIVTPPAVSVQPAVVSVTDAQMVTALQADGYTVTGSGSGSTGTTTPPAVGAWDGYIVNNGVLSPYWGGTPAPANQLANAPGGNWNSGFSQTFGASELILTPTGSFPEWLPHPQGVAGNPSQNGIAIDLKGYTEFVLTIKPQATIGKLSMFLCGVAGFGSYVGANPDVPVTDQALQPAAVIASNVPAGVISTYVVPLASLGWPNKTAPQAPYTAAATWIYKLALQINDPAAGTVLDIITAKFA